MKYRRFLAFVVLFAMVLSPAAMASQALGWELYQTDTVVGPGLSVSTQTLWGDSRQDYRTEQYVTYTPGQGVQPLVAYGATLPSTGTLTSMAKALEGYGLRVLAGANGDYFVMASGVPLGMVVTYGTLRSSSSYHYAVGFRADGSCFVGKPDLSVYADFHGYRLSVSGGYNKTRESKGGYTLFSSDMGAATKASGSGLNVILRPVAVPEGALAPEKPGPAPQAPTPPEGLDVDAIWAALEGQSGPDAAPYEVDESQLAALNQWEETRAQWAADMAAWEQSMEQWKQAQAQWAAELETVNARLVIGGELECVVESVVDQPGAVSIPEGRLVLSMDKGGDDFLVGALQDLYPGERFTLSVTSPDERWSQAETALGAYAWILQNGEVPSGLEQTAGPRTALGVKPSGQVILYTIDGRKPGHSVGAGVTQVAKRLQELGCTEAVLFDGGGSTTFGSTGALDQTFSLQNTPSEGAQRAVTNALFFVSQLQPTGELGSVYLEPQSALMLSGAKQRLLGKGIDTGYYPMGGEALSGLSYTVDGPGHMEGDTFVAGGEKGVATVTAKTSGGASGTARMTVVATPDVITVSDPSGKALTSLNLDPGQQAALNAAASWYKLPLLSDDSCFTWSLSEELGSVDEYGNITAGPRAGAGAITVSAGERSVSIPLTIGGHVNTLESWEDAGRVPDLEPDGPVQAELTREQARYGKSALKVTYPSWQETVLPLNMPIQAGESYLGLWLDAPTAPNLTLTAELTLSDGSAASAVVTTVDEEGSDGWQQFMVPIPENTVALSALRLTPKGYRGFGYQPDTGATITGGTVFVTLYLDHFTTANGPIVDTTPPGVKLSAQNGLVTATLSDNVDKSFDPARIELTIDGYSLPFELSGNTLTAQLPGSDTLLHRVSLTVADASGNLTRASVELAPSGERQPPFLDVEGHWAKDYIVYLSDQGVTNGRTVEGGYVFDPQTNITRGEFATMLCRWMRVDASGYDGVVLPFEDQGDIPAWALPSVRSLYALGIFTGSLEGDGLRANAGQSISRCQAMTMLGRVQSRGYGASQELFADHEDIPGWSSEYVYTLSAQGVVSGYGGYVRPLDPITRGEVAKLLTTLW